MVTYALFARNCFTRERYHSHNAQHSLSRLTTHKHSMQSEPSTLSSTTCTASCHLVACADSAAAEAVSDAATTAEFSPASSGYRRRAWNKRYDDRRERAERRSLRPPIVRTFSRMATNHAKRAPHSCTLLSDERARKPSRCAAHARRSRKCDTTSRRAWCAKVTILTV